MLFFVSYILKYLLFVGVLITFIKNNTDLSNAKLHDPADLTGLLLWFCHYKCFFRQHNRLD